MKTYHFSSDCLQGYEKPGSDGGAHFTTAESEGSDIKDLLANCTVGYDTGAGGTGYMWLSDLPEKLYALVEKDIAELVGGSAA